MYGAVPPLADTEAMPLLRPLQEISIPDAVVIIADGSEIMMVTESLAPPASVTMNVCVPAFTENNPTPVYGAIPPEAVISITPVPPLHGICELIAAVT